MTHAPDPQFADSLVNWVLFVSGVAIALWRRGKQNGKLAEHIDSSLDAQVDALKRQVMEMRSALTVTQDLVSIHTDRLKDGNTASAVLSSKLEQMDQTVQKGETLIAQFNTYLERAKAGTLIEKPIPGSGGLSAIKKGE